MRDASQILILAASCLICACGKEIADLEGMPRTTAEMDILRYCLREFQKVNGRLPTTAEGLQVLVDQRVIERVPVDPWGRPYQYVLLPSNECGYDLYSLGPDPKKSSDDIRIK